MTRPATYRRKRILITLGVLVATASYNPAHGQDLGQFSVNPYATDAPKLYDEEGNYRGKLSANPYDPESVSNPYDRYGSEHSADRRRATMTLHPLRTRRRCCRSRCLR